MNVNYLMFHTMDPEMAVEDFKEIYRQKGVCKIWGDLSIPITVLFRRR